MRLLALLLPLLAVVQAQEEILSFVKGMRERMMSHMMKESTGCLKINPLPKMIPLTMTCLNETMMMNFDEFRQNDFLPDMMVVKKFLNDFKLCHMKALGVDSYGPPLSQEEMMKKCMVDEWTGEDRQKAVNYVTDCAIEVNIPETALEQFISIEKCIWKKVINYCETMGESPGSMMPKMLLFNTLREPPKCSNVEVPKEHQMNLLECIEQSRKNMTTNINFINEITSESNLKTKMKMFGQGFYQDVIWGTLECMTKNDTDTFNPQTMTISMKNAATYVTNFKGWDNSDDSQAIYDGMIKCNKYYEESVPSDGETRLEGIKRLMKVHKRFDSCFFPVLADTCGITNEKLAAFFLPMADKAMNEKLMTSLLKSVVFMGVEHAKYFWENGLPSPLKMFS